MGFNRIKENKDRHFSKPTKADSKKKLQPVKKSKYKFSTNEF